MSHIRAVLVPRYNRNILAALRYSTQSKSSIFDSIFPNFEINSFPAFLLLVFQEKKKSFFRMLKIFVCIFCTFFNKITYSNFTWMQRAFPRISRFFQILYSYQTYSPMPFLDFSSKIIIPFKRFFNIHFTNFVLIGWNSKI